MAFSLPQMQTFLHGTFREDATSIVLGRRFLKQDTYLLTPQQIAIARGFAQRATNRENESRSKSEREPTRAELVLVDIPATVVRNMERQGLVVHLPFSEGDHESLRGQVQTVVLAAAVDMFNREVTRWSCGVAFPDTTENEAAGSATSP
jgi:hypothetical protein